MYVCKAGQQVKENVIVAIIIQSLTLEGCKEYFRDFHIFVLVFPVKCDFVSNRET